MITDFHVHSFPEKIAKKALESLSKTSHMLPFTEGTYDALSNSMKKSGIDKSILMPVATVPSQTQSVNTLALTFHEQAEVTGIDTFGAIHPENDNYREIIRDLHNNGISGIKLHPLFQNYALDDIRNMRIIECASSYDMAITVHAGFDISYPGVRLATYEHVLPVINSINPTKLILAHMGGWNCWDEVESELAGSDVYFDTSFSLTTVVGTDNNNKKYMSNEQFVRLVRKHGTNKILFGSDSPWSDQKESIEVLKQSGLSTDEINTIFSNSPF